MASGTVGPAQWEYRVVTLAALDEDAMNDLGNDGWELVAAAGLTLIFKRERKHG